VVVRVTVASVFAVVVRVTVASVFTVVVRVTVASVLSVAVVRVLSVFANSVVNTVQLSDLGSVTLDNALELLEA